MKTVHQKLRYKLYHVEQRLPHNMSQNLGPQTDPIEFTPHPIFPRLYQTLQRRDFVTLRDNAGEAGLLGCPWLYLQTWWPMMV